MRRSTVSHFAQGTRPPQHPQFYEPRAEEGSRPVGEEDAPAQEAVWSLASGSFYSVYQLFVNFAASKLNCKKHQETEEMTFLDAKGLVTC